MAENTSEKIKGQKTGLTGYASGGHGLLFADDSWIAKYMPAIEARLRKYAETPGGFASKIIKYMIAGSGKRLRPAFTLAGYLLVAEGLSPQAIDLAACSELIHCATLFHDDVIDSSETRKGRSSANAIWGNRTAIISGDYLFSLAFSVICKLKRLDITDEYIDVSMRLGEGVIKEIDKTYDPEITEEEYLDIISKKTASFFRTSIRTGAMLAGAPREMVDAAGRFAYNFGMTFQITDDVIDLFSDENRTGKPRGLDLREGVYTLPVIYAMRVGDNSILDILTNNGDMGEDEINAIAEKIEESGGLAYAVERARDYHRRATEALNEMPPSDSKGFLERVSEKVILRQF